MLVGTVKKAIREVTGIEVEFYRLVPANDNDTLKFVRGEDDESDIAKARKDRSLEGTDVYFSQDEDNL